MIFSDMDIHVFGEGLDGGGEEGGEGGEGGREGKGEGGRVKNEVEV